jgi:hypothetical protein
MSPPEGLTRALISWQDRCPAEKWFQPTHTWASMEARQWSPTRQAHRARHSWPDTTEIGRETNSIDLELLLVCRDYSPLRTSRKTNWKGLRIMENWLNKATMLATHWMAGCLGNWCWGGLPSNEGGGGWGYRLRAGFRKKYWREYIGLKGGNL